MKKSELKNKKILLGLTTLVSIFYGGPAQAGYWWDTMRNNFISTGVKAGFTATADPGKQPNFIQILGAYVNGMLALMGILFMVLIMYGGFIWMTAQGDTPKVDKAKNIIKGAIIGIGVVLLSMVITNFALGILKAANG